MHFLSISSVLLSYSFKFAEIYQILIKQLQPSMMIRSQKSQMISYLNTVAYSQVFHMEEYGLKFWVLTKYPINCHTTSFFTFSVPLLDLKNSNFIHMNRMLFLNRISYLNTADYCQVFHMEDYGLKFWILTKYPIHCHLTSFLTFSVSLLDLKNGSFTHMNRMLFLNRISYLNTADYSQVWSLMKSSLYCCC